MEKLHDKALHFLTAILDVYRDEEKRELDAFGKLDLKDDITEDFTALLLAIHVAMQEMTGFDGDLIDMTHALNKLAFQYLMESKAVAVDDEVQKPEEAKDEVPERCELCDEWNPSNGVCNKHGICTAPWSNCNIGGEG